MKCTTLLSFALTALMGTTSALAQTAAPAAMECGMSTLKRHDHGAERNTGATAGAMTMPCAAADSASAPAKTAKKKPAHDHAKFHKNQ